MSEIRLRRADTNGPSANFYDEIIRLRSENELLRARVLQLEQHGTSMGEIDRGGYSGSGIDYIEENKRLRARVAELELEQK